MFGWPLDCNTPDHRYANARVPSFVYLLYAQQTRIMHLWRWSRPGATLLVWEVQEAPVPHITCATGLAGDGMFSVKAKYDAYLIIMTKSASFRRRSPSHLTSRGTSAHLSMALSVCFVLPDCRHSGVDTGCRRMRPITPHPCQYRRLWLRNLHRPL